MIEVLRQVSKEDPSIKIEINEETGESLMHGMGELHLEIIENRILSEKGLKVITSPPIVTYRESISKASTVHEGKSPNKHNRLMFKVEQLEKEVSAGIKEGSIRPGRIKKKDPLRAFLLFIAMLLVRRYINDRQAIMNTEMEVQSVRIHLLIISVR